MCHLSNELKLKNREYFDSYDSIKKRRETDYSTESGMTTHSGTHLGKVEENIWGLFTDDNKDKLNDLELYVLLCAIRLHDISMSRGIRVDHHIESAKIVRTDTSYKFIDENIRLVIADVIESHGMNKYEELLLGTKYVNNSYLHSNGTIRVGVLMALLRMGDLMDWDASRAPVSVKEGKPVIGISLTYWFVHELITAIIPNHNTKTIQVSGNIKGYYSCRILNYTIDWFNAELNSNQSSLREFGIELNRFKFDEATLTRMLPFTTNNISNVFKPFISYDKTEYNGLFGRDYNETELIAHILEARKNKKITVLSGVSGVGKTSLLRARILCAFSEMGFDVKYINDYSNLNSFFNFESTLPHRHTLFILDQFERVNADIHFWDKIKSITECDSNPDRGLFHVLISIKSTEYFTTINKIMNQSIQQLSYILAPVDIANVVKAMLGQLSLTYETTIISQIVNYLTVSGEADICNIHIVFKSIIEKDKDLLCSTSRIEYDYGSIPAMVDRIISMYFDSKFMFLSDKEKQLLKVACNANGDGTIRVQGNKADIEFLHTLSDKHIIRIYNLVEYEFLHDILAQRYFVEVLSEHEKVLATLQGKIASLTLDVESLTSISKYRKEISAFCLSTIEIANLLYSYSIQGKDFEDEVDFWLSQTNDTELIVCLKKRLENSFINTSIDETKLYAVSHCIKKWITQINKLKTNEVLSELKKSIIDGSSYTDRCISYYLYNNIEEFGDDSISINTFITKYTTALYNNQAEILVKELFYYLSSFNLIEDLLQNKRLSMLHTEQILSLFADFRVNKKISFFTEINEGFIHYNLIKANSALSILAPYIAEHITTFSMNRGAIFSYSEPYIFKTSSGKSFNMQIERASLVKFTWKINTDAFLCTCSNGQDVLIALFKSDKSEMNEIFSLQDAKNFIWRYKTDFSNNYYNAEYINRFLPFKLPRVDQAEYLLAIIISILDYSETSKVGDIVKMNNYLKEKGNIVLDHLYGCLHIINYILTLGHWNPFPERISIVLVAEDGILINSHLYNSFYIKIVLSDSSERIIDPFHVQGINSTLKYELPFSLINKRDSSVVTKIEIPQEVEFLDNSSPAMLINIGMLNESLMNTFNDCFSFRIMWDDKINRVSKAVDAWEYELIKLISVLENNCYITDLFVIGNIENCKKTIKLLMSCCINEEIANLPINWNDKVEALYPNNQYFKDGNISVLSNKRLHIISGSSNVQKKNIVEALSNYFIGDNYSTLYYIDKKSSTETDSDISNECKTFLAKQSLSAEQLSPIVVNDIDNAYKSILASLICFGKEQVDLYGKRMLELQGIGLKIVNVYEKGYHMSYRRDDIDYYYQSQWLDDNGSIKVIADSQMEFDVIQKDIIVNELAETIQKKRGNRKLSIIFYKPTKTSIQKMAAPSLFSCFLFPRYSESKCLIDVIFVWRTSECVLGLPLSLESSIRWVDEVIIKSLLEKVKETVVLGDYTYYGINMHCYNNSIMNKLIKNVITAESDG